MKSYLPYNVNLRCKTMVGSERISVRRVSISVSLPEQPAKFSTYFIFYNILHTMAKRSRDSTFNSDSDDEFQFDSDNTGVISSSSGSEILATSKAPRCFNVGSDSSSNEDMIIQENDGRSDNEWTNVTNHDIIPQKIQFSSGSRTPGSQLQSTYKEPLDFFNSFFTEELIKKIVEETNRYANDTIQRKHVKKRSTWRTWTNVTLKEMRAFLGIILLMGTMPLPSLKDYWSTDRKCRIPYFAEVFRRDRFLQVFWMLHTNDKRIVTMLSTCATSSSTTVTKRSRKEGVTDTVKPDVVLNYNKYMGGVDKADQYTGTYCFMRKSQKWWRKLFFWGLDVSVINSYLLYQEHHKKHNLKKLSHLEFVRRLVDQLVGDFRDADPKPPSTSTTVERLNGLLHIIRRNETGRSKDCVVCSNRKVKHGRRESMYYCATCSAKPTLHIGDCFERYHTKEQYKTYNM